MTLSIDSVDGPNVPPQVIEDLKARWVHPTHGACLKPDQVDKPPQEFFTDDPPSNCSYEHFSMSRGKINATINCPLPEVSMVAEITGKVKPKSLRLGLNLIIDTHDKGARVAVDTTMEGKRIGDC